MYLRPADAPRCQVEEENEANAGSPIFCMITPSNIAYVCEIIKNRKDMWDQAKRLMNDPDAEPKKKAKPQFSTGEGKKRESGKSVWNMEGLEFYYNVEKNWREVYNSKEEFTALINGWEKWEPMDKRTRRTQSGLSGDLV